MATLVKFIEGEPVWEYTVLEGNDNEPHPALEFQQTEASENDTWYSHIRREDYGDTKKDKDKVDALVRKLSETLGEIPRPIYIRLSTTGYHIPKRMGLCTSTCKGTFNGRVVAAKFILTFQTIEKHIKKWNHEWFAEIISTWRGLKHENILEVFGVDVTQIFLKPYVVLPWVENGNVREYMKKLKSPVSRDQKNAWILQTAKGLEYLHDKEIVHGNVRGSNVMINDNGIAQLTDLQLFVIKAEVLSRSPLQWTATDDRRLQLWMAPEILNHTGGRSTHSDVYSFGKLCCEIYTEKDPPILRPPQPLLPTPMEDALFYLIIGPCWGDVPEDRPYMASVANWIERQTQ